MIEAALDRTLVHADPRHLAITERLDNALGAYASEKNFEEFIEFYRKELEITRPEMEESLWSLIDRGKLVLSHDFNVLKKR